jgi:hypothetical protein
MARIFKPSPEALNPTATPHPDAKAGKRAPQQHRKNNSDTFESTQNHSLRALEPSTPHIFQFRAVPHICSHGTMTRAYPDEKVLNITVVTSRLVAE